jgi:hypothetical protein
MTKTERVLLEKACRSHHGGMHAVTSYSTSSRAGLRGTRAADAIKSLCRKGLATDLRIESNHEPNLDGWGTTHYTEFGATITEAGRKALQGQRVARD